MRTTRQGAKKNERRSTQRRKGEGLTQRRDAEKYEEGGGVVSGCGDLAYA